MWRSPRSSGGILLCLFRGRNKSDNVTGWGYVFCHGELAQLPRDILMNSASKAFGKWAANFEISCLNEKLIFDDLNLFNKERKPL